MMKRSTILQLIGYMAVGLLLSLIVQQCDNLKPGSDRVAPSPMGPQRIICGAPNLVEIVYALGQENRIVAVTDYTTFPPEALNKESIGGAFNPNNERILSLNPDLFIIQGAMEKQVALCNEYSIPKLQLHIEDLASLYDGIQQIGNALHCQDQAKTLIQSIKDDLSEIRHKHSSRSRKSVFLCIGRPKDSLSGLFTINQDTFLHEILEQVGGRNIFADAPTRYPQISTESLIERAPDVIIELKMDAATLNSKTIIDDWKQMPSLPAVANGRIHIVTDDYMLIASPRIVLTAQRLAGILYGTTE